MSFTSKQISALRRNVHKEKICSRSQNNRELFYIEGSHAIAEANRIFGFDNWDRETIETKCVLARETRGIYVAVYTAKSRITVNTGTGRIIREGHGCAEAKASSPGEAHDLALKSAETDATKRALVTFGKAFGLNLYASSRSRSAEERSFSKKSEYPREPALSKDSVSPAEPASTSEPDMPLVNDTDKGLHAAKIDKSGLTFGTVRRLRDKTHLRYVASQPCLMCSFTPSDPHHLRFAQPRALGMKVSDEFTVPLCRKHHRQLHRSGNEVAWWHDMGIEPVPIAKELWNETRSLKRR